MARGRMWLLALVLTALVSMASGPSNGAVFAQAAEATAFEKTTIWVNPEYDDARLLVMIEGKVVGGEIPALVRFLVPATAEMYSAGSKDILGDYTGGPPDRKPSAIPGWDEVSYEVTTRTFRVEYYDDVIPSEPEKKFFVSLPLLYPVSDLKVVIQEPRNSTNFVVAPDGVQGRDTGGFAVHTLSYTTLAPDTQLGFDVSYTRTDTKPSLSTNANAPGSTSSTTAPQDWSANLITIFIAVIAIGSVVFMWGVAKSRKKTRPAAARASAGPGISRSANGAAAGSGNGGRAVNRPRNKKKKRRH